jgi:ferrochelatase
MPDSSRRIAVVLFNLGGPDRPEAVRPFLFNLFSDPAIIALPAWPRQLIAWLVARRRAPLARKIYAQLGGGSPLLANTAAQARALEQALTGLGTVRAFPCMRYWHPRSAEVAAELRAFAPDETVLLPLYPQFSSTTTASSLADWRGAAQAAGLAEIGRAICCYPAEPGFIAAIAEGVAAARERQPPGAPPARILFTAHGLPKRVVERGDPYVAQVEATVAAVVRRLGLPEGSWRLCFQSRVGPLEWVGPYADAEIRAAGAERLPLIVVPVAFVSEHSETLVELDIEYRRLAVESGVPAYLRVPTAGTAPAFIAGLARLVRQALAQPGETGSGEGGRRCAADRSCCPLPGPAIEEAA